MTTTLHRYFKKTFDGLLVLVQLDPERLTGVELLVDENGQVVRTERVFDEDIYQDLEVDEFEAASPLEFNLYLKGLTTE